MACQGPTPAPERPALPSPIAEPSPAEASEAPGSATSTGEVDSQPPVSPSPPEQLGPCPPGMALVEGGPVSKKQQARWKKHYPGAVTPPAEVAPFCLDLLETTEDDLAAGGEAFLTSMRFQPWCVKRGECSNMPPPQIDMHDAALYCTHRGKRMPTLTEWLWAAGGGTEDRKYPWGSAAPTARYLNACDLACARQQMGDCSQEEFDSGFCTEKNMSDVPGDDGYPERAPVGSFPAGAGRWGHLDLAGNVEEYVLGGDDLFFRCGGTYRWTRRLFDFSLHKRVCEPGDVGGEPVSVRCAADPTRAD